MKTIVCYTAFVGALCLFLLPAPAQQTRAFNQNASRSNHTRLGLTAMEPWSVGMNAGASFTTKSRESTLFRGSSMATKFFTTYYFDKLGLGLSMGIIPGSIDNKALNSFIDERKLRVDNLQVRKANPFNSYLLAGPSFRFGNRVIVNASIQGGLFFNDPGTVSIARQQGPDIQELYGFMAAEQKLFAGFNGSFQIAYPLGNSTQFFIQVDYLQSRNAIRVLDVNGGIPVHLTQNRNLHLITTGIGIIKSFGGQGRSSGKRQYTPAIGRLTVPAANNATSSCGPVMHRITRADGSTEELEFNCPDDAAAYALRMSQGDTVRIRQTQGKTFGEPIRHGLPAADGNNPDATKTQAQDHNSSRSNKSSSITQQPGDTNNASQQKVQDHNSSRSNKSASIAAQPGDTTDASQQKVQDHNSSRSNKSASIAVQPGDTTDTSQQKVQDHNSSRSNKSASIAEQPGDTTNASQQKAQDHNSSRSNKTASSIAVDADMDGDGVYETDVTEKVNNKISFRINEQGEMTEQQTKAANNTSNSRFRSSGKLETIGNNLYIGYGTAEIENRRVPVKLIYK